MSIHRAAYDSVNRKQVLMKTMREREIRERLVIRVVDNKGDKEQGKDKRINRRRNLNSKASKTRLPIKSDFI